MTRHLALSKGTQPDGASSPVGDACYNTNFVLRGAEARDHSHPAHPIATRDGAPIPLRDIKSVTLGSSELPEKAEIAFIEILNVIDGIFQHGETLNSQAERKAGIAFRVVVHIMEHGRVDHAATEDLNPA